jgi:hypothetical protein
MRRAIGSYSRFKARGGARVIAPLKLERLEERLTLSHNAPDVVIAAPTQEGHDGTVTDFGGNWGDNGPSNPQSPIDVHRGAIDLSNLSAGGSEHGRSEEAFQPSGDFQGPLAASALTQVPQNFGTPEAGEYQASPSTFAPPANHSFAADSHWPGNGELAGEGQHDANQATSSQTTTSPAGYSYGVHSPDAYQGATAASGFQPDELPPAIAYTGTDAFVLATPQVNAVILAVSPPAFPTETRVAGMNLGSPGLAHSDYGSAIDPHAADDYHGAPSQVPVLGNYAPDNSLEYVVTVSVHMGSPPPPYGQAQPDAHHDPATVPGPPAGDPHTAHPRDASTTTSAGDSQPRQSVQLAAIGPVTDSAALAPQAVIDAFKRSGPTTTTGAPVAPQQTTTPPGSAADASVNRSLGGIVLIPQTGSELGGLFGAPLGPSPQGDREVDVAAASDEVALASSEEAVANPSSAASVDSDATIEAVSPIARAALLGNMQLNLEAVDQALDAMVSEVERLGGELVTWLDDWTISDWGTAAVIATAAGVGGRYVLRQRARRAAPADSEEESSSWLFTRLQSPPTGQG